MKENSALQQEQAAMRQRIIAANSRYYEDIIRDQDIELTRARQEVIQLRMQLSRAHYKTARANMKKHSAIRLAKSVNLQNKRFQAIASANNAKVAMRAIPDTFFYPLESDSESDSGLSSTEEVENPDDA
ncbi:hypothetical protein AC1031_015082 [Aphanomyces cochlioides]|nr:hypothetical protein AC1031_015082 [Aphanomyces cochlioides]